MVLAVDQASKALVLTHLAPGQSVPILGTFLTLRVERNTGAAFGLLGGTTVPLAALAVAICAALWYLSGRSRQPGVAWSLGLVLGGALGNLVDRIVRHGVVDFIDVRLFSVFNAADTAITLGALWLLWQIARSPEGTERP